MYTVVVADDEEELRRALIRRVDWESVGFSVVGEAENGVEALELVEKYEPDLLLTDIRMPFVSGIDLARQVREIRPATQIAFLSGFDDFSYAQQAIQYNIISYMLKPISAKELTEELGRIKAKIDQKFKEFSSQSEEQVQKGILEFLLPLLLDSFQGETEEGNGEQLMQEAVSCGLFKNTQNDFRYTVMVTSIVDDKGKNCTVRASVNAVDTILKKYVKHVSFYMEGRVVSLLIATQAGFDKYLHIIVEYIAQSVKRIMKLSSLIGVSRPVGRLSDLHEAYIEAMNAISYSKRNGTSVHFISDVERTDDFDIEKMQGYISDVEGFIRGGSRQELTDCLNEIFDRMEQQHITAAVANFIMIQLVSAVFRIVYAVADGEAVTELQRNTPLQPQGLFHNPLEIRSRYLEFCLSARELVTEQRKKSSHVLCDKALEIIENRYMAQDLSLVSISNEIAVSPNYLSSLIKKSTGSTFIDLLTKKRIETARELLLCSGMKIKEISEKCGYSDQHYFSYCFKKYMGMSPNACRRESDLNMREKTADQDGTNRGKYGK